MGYSLNTVKDFIAFINRKVNDEKIGSKVWLITGEGKILKSMIRIDNLPWFEGFKKQMAYFVGFAEIRHKKYIDELEKLV